MISSRIFSVVKNVIIPANSIGCKLGRNCLGFQERGLRSTKKKDEEDEGPRIDDVSWQWKPRKDMKKDCPRGPKCKQSFFPRIKKKYVKARDKTNNFVRKPKKKKTFNEIMTIIIRDYLMAKKDEKVPLYRCKVVSGMRFEKCADKKLCRPPPDWYGRTCKCKIPMGGMRPWVSAPGARERTMAVGSGGSKFKPSCQSKLPLQHLNDPKECPDKKCDEK